MTSGRTMEGNSCFWASDRGYSSSAGAFSVGLHGRGRHDSGHESLASCCMCFCNMASAFSVTAAPGAKSGNGLTRASSVCGVEAMISVFSSRLLAWSSKPSAEDAIVYAIVTRMILTSSRPRESSEDFVCRSAARRKSSSSSGKMPSPWNMPCRQAKKRRYSFAGRQLPSLTCFCNTSPSFLTTSAPNSGLRALASRMTDAIHGTFRGCSRGLWKVSTS